MSEAVHSCSRIGGRGRHADRTQTMPPRLDGAVAHGSSGSGPVSGRAPHQLPCPRWLPQEPPVSALVAGVREAAGHSSEPDCRRHGPEACRTSAPSGRRSFRKQRTVNPPLAPAHSDFLHFASRPPDMRRADPPGADVASCPIRSRRRSGGTSAATRAPISASLTAVSVDHGQARGGGRGQYDPASQASGGAAAGVSETPPSAAQDARVADGQSS
jgi:hypothetical protein